MNQENKTILTKRFKSLIWRILGMAIVMLLNFAADSIGLFDLAPGVVVLVGLIVGEITKYLNTNRK